MALGQALLDVLGKRGDIIFGGGGEKRLQRNVRLGVVGKAELVEDAQFIVVLENGRRLPRWAAERLLFLDIVGELAEGLPTSIPPSPAIGTCWNIQIRLSASLIGSALADVVQPWCAVAVVYMRV